MNDVDKMFTWFHDRTDDEKGMLNLTMSKTRGGIKNGGLTVFASTGRMAGRTTTYRLRLVAIVKDRLSKGLPVFLITANNATKVAWTELTKDFGGRLEIMTVNEFVVFTKDGGTKPEYENSLVIMDEMHDAQRKRISAKMFNRVNVRELAFQPERFHGTGSDATAWYINKRDADWNELPSEGPR